MKTKTMLVLVALLGLLSVSLLSNAVAAPRKAKAVAPAEVFIAPSVLSFDGWNFVLVDQTTLDTCYWLQFSDNAGASWQFTLVWVSDTRQVPWSFCPTVPPEGGQTYCEKSVQGRIYRLLRGGQQ